MTTKHENFSPGVWFECGALVTGDDGIVILRAAEHLSAGEASANTQRIVACVNAFAGIDTDRIYGKDLGEILAGEVRLNKAEPTEDGGFSFSFSGGVIQLMANAFAEQFKDSGAINYLELIFQHHELGQLNVTMQRVEGLTPAQKLAHAEKELENLKADFSIQAEKAGCSEILAELLKAVKADYEKLAAENAEMRGAALPVVLVDERQGSGGFCLTPHGMSLKLKHGTELFTCLAPPDNGASIRAEHAAWSQATFGNVGPVGPLKHLSKEAIEAAEAPEDLSEWADMQFLLWDAQRRAGITDLQIEQAMIEKLAINKARIWPAPKDGEPRLHIKSTESEG